MEHSRGCKSRFSECEPDFGLLLDFTSSKITQALISNPHTHVYTMYILSAVTGARVLRDLVFLGAGGSFVDLLLVRGRVAGSTTTFRDRPDEDVFSLTST